MSNQKTEGVSIPYDLATVEGFKEAIIEKIKEGPSADPNFKLLFDYLIDPDYKEHTDFIKELINKLIIGVQNNKIQSYLMWLGSNYNKCEQLQTKDPFQFANNTIDLFIRSKENTDNKMLIYDNHNFNSTSKNNYFDKRKKKLNPFKGDFIINVDIETTAESVIKSYYMKQAEIQYLFYHVKGISIDQAPRLVLIKNEEQEKKYQNLGTLFAKNEKRADWHDERLSSYEDLYTAQCPISLDELFSLAKQQNSCKWLILGRAGIGKTTLCKYIAWQWVCKKLWTEQFSWVFWIPLRNLSDQRYLSAISSNTLTLEEIIYNECFANDKRISLDWISKQIIHYENILLLLDGYDEISHLLTVTKYLERLIALYPQQILTSRPYALPIQLNEYHQLENIGFMNDDIKDYIYKFFQAIGCKEQAEKLLKYLINNPAIWGIAHIPINLELICSLWDETINKKVNFSASMTLTDLYKSIVYKLGKYYLEKRAHASITKEELQYMDEAKVESAYQNVLNFLEELAWQAQTRDEQSLILNKQLIQQLCNKYQLKGKDFLNGISRANFIKGVGNTDPIDQDYYFVHLTFQEYFAARYMVKWLQSEDSEKAETAVQALCSERRHENMFIFVAGLIENNSYFIRYFYLFIHIYNDHELQGLKQYPLLWLSLRCLEERRGWELLTIGQQKKLIELYRDSALKILLADYSYLNARVKSELEFQFKLTLAALRLSPIVRKKIGIDEALVELTQKGNPLLERPQAKLLLLQLQSEGKQLFASLLAQLQGKKEKESIEFLLEKIANLTIWDETVIELLSKKRKKFNVKLFILCLAIIVFNFNPKIYDEFRKQKLVIKDVKKISSKKLIKRIFSCLQNNCQLIDTHNIWFLIDYLVKLILTMKIKYQVMILSNLFLLLKGQAFLLFKIILIQSLLKIYHIFLLLSLRNEPHSEILTYVIKAVADSAIIASYEENILLKLFIDKEAKINPPFIDKLLKINKINYMLIFVLFFLLIKSDKSSYTNAEDNLDDESEDNCERLAINLLTEAKIVAIEDLFKILQNLKKCPNYNTSTLATNLLNNILQKECASIANSKRASEKQENISLKHTDIMNGINFNLSSSQEDVDMEIISKKKLDKVIKNNYRHIIKYPFRYKINKTSLNINGQKNVIDASKYLSTYKYSNLYVIQSIFENFKQYLKILFLGRLFRFAVKKERHFMIDRLLKITLTRYFKAALNAKYRAESDARLAAADIFKGIELHNSQIIESLLKLLKRKYKNSIFLGIKKIIALEENYIEVLSILINLIKYLREDKYLVILIHELQKVDEAGKYLTIDFLKLFKTEDRVNIKFLIIDQLIALAKVDAFMANFLIKMFNNGERNVAVRVAIIKRLVGLAKADKSLIDKLKDLLKTEMDTGVKFAIIEGLILLSDAYDKVLFDTFEKEFWIIYPLELNIIINIDNIFLILKLTLSDLKRQKALDILYHIMLLSFEVDNLFGKNVFLPNKNIINNIIIYLDINDIRRAMLINKVWYTEMVSFLAKDKSLANSETEENQADKNLLDKKIREKRVSNPTAGSSNVNMFFSRNYLSAASISNSPTENNTQQYNPFLNLNQLYNLFTNAEKLSQVESLELNNKATDYGIEQALNSYFSNYAHIIQPSLSSVSSPMDHKEIKRNEALKNYGERISGYIDQDGIQHHNGFIHEDGVELKKPIIMIMNTTSAIAKTSTDIYAEGDGHWVTCIILPKKYFIENKCFEYVRERVFFIDSLFPNRKLPQNFKNMLTRGYEYNGVRMPSEKEDPTFKEIPYKHLIRPSFPDAEFIDLENVPQQQGGEDCGWWAFYNAFMIVMSADSKYLNQFSERTREFAYKLRALLPSLSCELPSIDQKCKRTFCN